MIRSDNPTEYVLVTARANSDYQTIDFALLHITSAWLTNMAAALRTLDTVKAAAGKEFYHLSYWGNPEGFYSDPDGILVAAGIDCEAEDWCFVELDGTEQTSFRLPDEKLEAGQLRVYSDQVGRYVSYGKYSGTEYETSCFDIAALLQVAHLAETPQ